MPGRDLAVPSGLNAETSEGAFRVKGLPQHGFPYAVATTSVRIDAAQPSLRAKVLRVDPRLVRPAGSPGTTESTPTVASLFASNLRPPRPSEIGVWWSGGTFVTAAQPPGPDALLVAVGQPLARAAVAMSRVAACVHDEDGMLDWVELPEATAPDASTANAMDALLARDGCGTRVFVEGSARALLGGTSDLDGTAAQPPAFASARLVRAEAPGARPYFESTPIVSPGVWQPLQMQRVRYFPKPRSATPASSAPTPTPASSTTPPPPSP